MDIGITSREFQEMEYRDFVERCEIANRAKIEEWRKLRLILAAQTGQDPRRIIQLPGDWDHVPKAMSKEESMKILAKHGIDKILQAQLDKANKGK